MARGPSGEAADATQAKILREVLIVCARQSSTAKRPQCARKVFADDGRRPPRRGSSNTACCFLAPGVQARRLFPYVRAGLAPRTPFSSRPISRSGEAAPQHASFQLRLVSCYGYKPTKSMPVLRTSGGFVPMNGKSGGFGGDARCTAWPRALHSLDLEVSGKPGLVHAAPLSEARQTWIRKEVLGIANIDLLERRVQRIQQVVALGWDNRTRDGQYGARAPLEPVGADCLKLFA